MHKGVVWLVAVLLLQSADLLWGQATAAPTLTIQAAPERPIIELRDGSQFLNFDMTIRNEASEPVLISQVELSVYDAAGRLALRKSINTDAFAPSIDVIGERILAPGQSLDVFSPFSEFESSVPLTTLIYRFCFLRESNEHEKEKNRHRLPDDCDFRQQLTVVPRTYPGRTELILPLRGEVFVWEGHDFLAHHLRVPLGDPGVRRLGISANSNEFASDFIYVDEQGRSFHGDPRKLENWYGYGKAVYAPGAGIVLATANDIPENWFEDEKSTAMGHPNLPAGKDPKDIGNFVLIDHQNGEYSLLVHMKPGSVTVKPGDRVEGGQRIGRIGFAGDSIFPHLHYSLMEGAEVFKSWGLPAYFRHFHRVLGSARTDVVRGNVNSGDFVESDAVYMDSK